MKANNLTICVPYKGCDKSPPCPYCVSKITGGVESNIKRMHSNAKKVLTLARIAQVTSVLLTGKGEPFLNFGEILFFSNFFREFPLEIQTNGIRLGKHRMYIEDLARSGMNVIALSADDPYSQGGNIANIVKSAHRSGLLVRATINVTRLLEPTGDTFDKLIGYCREWNVDQLTLRNIVAPNHTADTKETRWIECFSDVKLYDRLKAGAESGYLIRTLPTGSRVYDHGGIAVSFSDYCVQDSNNSEDIRSLIFQEDGHMYTSWNSRASMLF